MDKEPIVDKEQERARQQYLATLPPIGKWKIIDPNGKVVFTGKLLNLTGYRFRTVFWLVIGLVCIVGGLANDNFIPLLLFGTFAVLFGLYIFISGRMVSNDNGS